MSEVIVAKTAGFCYGVARAVGLVEDALEQGERVCTLGPIIHNTVLVESLAARGARVIDRIEDAAPEETIVLRSHGVEQSVVGALTQEKRKFLDGTCPFVAKIHKIVISASSKGDTIILVGDICHPEVRATLSRCTTPTYCVQSLEEAKALLAAHPELRTTPVALLAQTTASAKIFQEIEEFTKLLCTNLEFFDTICSATAERQREAEQLSKRVDCMLVIGSPHSSNTRKLLEICRENGPAYQVETAADLPLDALRGCERIGVTAGASAPVFIIKEVQETCVKNCGTRACSPSNPKPSRR